MLEFSQTTIANMTAALDYGCGLLSSDMDTSENRKRIADALIASAKAGDDSLVQLKALAQRVVDAIDVAGKKSALKTVRKMIRRS